MTHCSMKISAAFRLVEALAAMNSTGPQPLPLRNFLVSSMFLKVKYFQQDLR